MKAYKIIIILFISAVIGLISQSAGWFYGSAIVLFLLAYIGNKSLPENYKNKKIIEITLDITGFDKDYQFNIGTPLYMWAPKDKNDMIVLYHPDSVAGTGRFAKINGKKAIALNELIAATNNANCTITQLHKNKAMISYTNQLAKASR